MTSSGDNDLGQFRLDWAAARNNLFNGLFFSSGRVWGYFHTVGLSILSTISERARVVPINCFHSGASFV